MLPVIVVPDAELWWTGWLRAALAARSEDYATGVKVDHVTPAPLPARLVTVRRDGGPREDLLHSRVRLGINVWAMTEQDATNLAALIEGLVLSVRTTGQVEAVNSVSGPSPVPDSQPRRFFTVEAITRGAVA